MKPVPIHIPNGDIQPSSLMVWFILEHFLLAGKKILQTVENLSKKLG